MKFTNNIDDAEENVPLSHNTPTTTVIQQSTHLRDPTYPKVRKPFSKFTISTKSSQTSSTHLVPAHRSCATESLPVVNSAEFPLNNAFSTQKPSYSSSGSRTRQLLLQKKTIHRSLEDLRDMKRNRNDHFAVPVRKSAPFVAKDSSHQSKLASYSRKRVSTQDKDTFSNSNFQRMGDNQRNFQVQTDNIINTEDSGGSGDNSISIPSNTIAFQSTYPDSALEKESPSLLSLSTENNMLKGKIEEEKRKTIFYRIVNAFVFQAMKTGSGKLIEMENQLQFKREECAARIILHHLLLNSWKMTKSQAASILMDNTQMHKTIDNQSLQLSIVRKIQSMEKEKAATLVKEYNDLKQKNFLTMKENEAIKEEYAKLLEEKRSTANKIHCLKEENSKLNNDLRVRLDKKEMELHSIELDRLRADKFLKDNQDLSKEAESVKTKIKDLSTQRNHWQEKAMTSESKCFALKFELEEKELAYQAVSKEKQTLSTENEILVLAKSLLERDFEDVRGKLVHAKSQNEALEIKYKQCQEEMEDLEDRVKELNIDKRQLKKANEEIRQQLYDGSLKNVKKRRFWGAAFYLFVQSPIEAFKKIYFGGSEPLAVHGRENFTRKKTRPTAERRMERNSLR